MDPKVIVFSFYSIMRLTTLESTYFPFVGPSKERPERRQIGKSKLEQEKKQRIDQS